MCERLGYKEWPSRMALDLVPDATTWTRHEDRRTTWILHAPLEPTRNLGFKLVTG
jgi:hypothetical protein